VKRRPALMLAAALATTVTLVGCGGGGGGGGDTPAASSVAPSSATPSGTAAGQVPADDGLYGTLTPVDPELASGTLSGYDELGVPRDAFAQIVRDQTGSGGSPTEPTVGGVPTTTPATPVPATGDPLVAVPGGTVPVTTPTTPTATSPAPVDATPVEGREANFDIGGEPVVARVGDAVPPQTQQFTVSKVDANSVTLTLNGGLLPDGTDTVTLKEGESITLDNQTAGTSYTVKLLSVK
jgi:hypothetical protein